MVSIGLQTTGEAPGPCLGLLPITVLPAVTRHGSSGGITRATTAHRHVALGVCNVQTFTIDPAPVGCTWARQPLPSTLPPLVVLALTGVDNTGCSVRPHMSNLKSPSTRPLARSRNGGRVDRQLRQMLRPRRRDVRADRNCDARPLAEHVGRALGSLRQAHVGVRLIHVERPQGCAL